MKKWRSLKSRKVPVIFETSVNDRCKGKNKKGEPCGMKARKGAHYCWHHSPSKMNEFGNNSLLRRLSFKKTPVQQPPTAPESLGRGLKKDEDDLLRESIRRSISRTKNDWKRTSSEPGNPQWTNSETGAVTYVSPNRRRDLPQEVLQESSMTF